MALVNIVSSNCKWRTIGLSVFMMMMMMMMVIMMMNFIGMDALLVVLRVQRDLEYLKKIIIFIS